jgi:hypothetical protein
MSKDTSVVLTSFFRPNLRFMVSLLMTNHILIFLVTP